MRKFLAILALCAVAEGVCFCGVHEGDIVPCDDIEARDECNAANDEVTDTVNSVGLNADMFLRIAQRKKQITARQASRLRTHLSYALEQGKPVGDCAGGLSTQTRVKHTLSHCFSSTILHQCKNIKDRIPSYAAGIPQLLRSSIAEANDTTALGISLSNKLVTDYVTAVQHRATIQTANVRCASYEQTSLEIASGATLSYSLLPFALALAALL